MTTGLDRQTRHQLSLRGITVQMECKCRLSASVNWVSIASGNGLSPTRRQAIAWTNGDLLPAGPLGTNFSEIRIKI